jgi:hypothetical protein
LEEAKWDTLTTNLQEPRAVDDAGTILPIVV